MNKSSIDASTPFFSVPAIGWPGTKLEIFSANVSLALLTIPPLTLPTSVKTAFAEIESAISGNIFSDTDNGVPIIITSAPLTASDMFRE